MYVIKHEYLSPVEKIKKSGAGERENPGKCVKPYVCPGFVCVPVYCLK
jgi:hypothetical protein